MNTKHFIFILSVICTSNCTKPQKMIEIHGHRGARGYFPENTIPSFKAAFDMGAKTMEMDVAISNDHKVVVSHEPWFNHEISTHPDGENISEQNQMSFNLYKMDYAKIKSFDVGQKGNPRFKQQKAIPVRKPLLTQVIEEMERHSDQTVSYNIEIKRRPSADGLFHPDASTFVQLVSEVIKEQAVDDRCIIQSFDIETLQLLNKDSHNFKIALLVSGKENFKEKQSQLGFIPEVLSPFFGLVNNNMIRFARRHKMKVIPWTVNEVMDIQKMIDLGVDGIISDYPDRVYDLVNNPQ